jgi:hypothetical protein
MDFKIQSCDAYIKDYRHCNKLTSRLEQYYVYGKRLDCKPLKELMLACLRYKQNVTLDDYKILIMNEQKKKEEFKRINEINKQNDIWSYRDVAPSDWNAPLPEWAQDRIKQTSWFTKEENKQE